MFSLSAQLQHCAIVGGDETQFRVIMKAKLLDVQLVIQPRNEAQGFFACWVN